MTTGERIRILRMEKGLSQEGLADALDVTRQAVSRWETDASLPDIDKLIGLCDLFGVSLDYLVRGKIPACDNTQDKAESPDTSTPHYSIPISRTTIAGILCIVLGVSAAPLLVFLFTPFFRLRYLIMAMVPIALLLAGILLLLRKVPSTFYCCWGLLLTGALGYTYRYAEDLSDLVRGLMARYPALLYRNWEEIQKQMLVWPWIGLLIIGMICWTVLRYRMIGLVNRKRRWLFLSLGLFSGSILLLAASAFLITRNISLDGVVRMGVLYLLFWLAVLSLTYSITWLLSPSKHTPASPDPTTE